jgi:hypothetical protein
MKGQVNFPGPGDLNCVRRFFLDVVGEDILGHRSELDARATLAPCHKESKSEKKWRNARSL